MATLATSPVSLVDAVVVAVELLEDGVVGHEDRPPLPQTHCPAHLPAGGDSVMSSLFMKSMMILTDHSR